MLNIYQTKEEASRAAAQHFIERAKLAIEAKAKFTVALTGGSSPAGMYDLLTTEFKDQVDWDKIFIFWGDERWVPIEDDRSNAGNAFKDFLNKVAIPNEQIFPMYKDGISAEDYAKEYSAILDQVLEDGTTFDLIFLGMGDDGHTASLFPGEEIIHEKEKKVDAYFLKPQDMYRITLTAPLLNSAKSVAFIAFGAKKADALFEVIKGEKNIEKYPSQIIDPKGELMWYVDKEAAARI
ncbi:6-phosphogluconolactonase [Zunongwangia sp. SCSIO 43204]|uniref:6-phosphogluconolactonase n=1 Tax=Zunongwangia sp. SCSIO 43204 TaxID=2779359 RepID=UPI001CAA3223|nr:6-phosphogluconolactonase [Zunongwangia sp. SCSIO 43204]UAB83400.1 6-phosphogluconolactonase [Zunongwangia sp. SCSIO 43204]